MVEAVLIAVVTATITSAAGYLLVVVRLDERSISMQKDIEYLRRSSNDAEIKANTRLERIEDLVRDSIKEQARQSAEVSKALGQLEGRATSRNWQRGGP